MNSNPCYSLADCFTNTVRIVVIEPQERESYARLAAAAGYDPDIDLVMTSEGVVRAIELSIANKNLSLVNLDGECYLGISAFNPFGQFSTVYVTVHDHVIEDKVIEQHRARFANARRRGR